MSLAHLLGPDLRATLANDPDELIEALEELHPEDVAEMVHDLPDEDALALMRALPEEFAGQVMERLDEETQTRILERAPASEAATFLTEMSADDRVDALQELDDDVFEKIVAEIEKVDPEVAEETRELTEYAPDSAGGLMTTEYISLPPETKVWQVIDEVRRASKENEVETIYYVYVTGFGDKLLGVVSLRDLILADPANTLADTMTESVVRVLPTDYQETVAKTIAKYDLHAVPVVDDKGVMLGVVTVDDVVDVVIEEATEDAQRMGAVAPLEDSYFDTGYFAFVRKRAMWLVVLFLGGLVTTNVMGSFQGAMHRIVELTFFVPLIISAGGNAGSQSASLVIRALATNEVRPADWFKVLVREVTIGLALGLILGVVGFGRGFFASEGVTSSVSLALTVSLSVIAVVNVGTLAGSLLPLVIKRVGLDPAISSTPFIASLVDVLGLLVYFSCARLVFGI